jgi:hypothetical protein
MSDMVGTCHMYFKHWNSDEFELRCAEIIKYVKDIQRLRMKNSKIYNTLIINCVFILFPMTMV